LSPEIEATRRGRGPPLTEPKKCKNYITIKTIENNNDMGIKIG